MLSNETIKSTGQVSLGPELGITEPEECLDLFIPRCYHFLLYFCFCCGLVMRTNNIAGVLCHKSNNGGHNTLTNESTAVCRSLFLYDDNKTNTGYKVWNAVEKTPKVSRSCHAIPHYALPCSGKVH